MFILASIADAAPGKGASESMIRPRPSSARTSCIATQSERSATPTPSLSATTRLASGSRSPRVICMRATRSPAARSPFIPQAVAWALGIPKMSPVPTYNPSTCSRSTKARPTRETASTGGQTLMGTPPTPIPALTCTGMRRRGHARLEDRDRARHVPGHGARRC